MTTTDVAKPGTVLRAITSAGHAVTWVVPRAKAVAKRGWPGRIQLLGAASILGGVYHGFGLTATLIIGGVAAVVGGALREGNRI